jgi:putative membrane protein
MEIQQPDRGPHQNGELTPAHVDVRQQLAADRTLLAWIRTAIALSALGFVVARFDLFLHQIRRVSAANGEAVRIIGLALVAAAALLLVLGLRQYRQITALLADHGDPLDAPRWPAVFAAVACLLAIVAVGIYLATGVN